MPLNKLTNIYPGEQFAEEGRLLTLLPTLCRPSAATRGIRAAIAAGLTSTHKQTNKGMYSETKIKLLTTSCCHGRCSGGNKCSSAGQQGREDGNDE